MSNVLFLSQALLAKLDFMRSAAESQLAGSDFNACISTCSAALALDQEETYGARGVMLALKEKAENKSKAAELLSFGKEQLAANDFRAVPTPTSTCCLSRCPCLCFCLHLCLCLGYMHGPESR